MPIFHKPEVLTGIFTLWFYCTLPKERRRGTPKKRTAFRRREMSGEYYILYCISFRCIVAWSHSLVSGRVHFLLYTPSNFSSTSSCPPLLRSNEHLTKTNVVITKNIYSTRTMMMSTRRIKKKKRLCDLRQRERGIFIVGLVAFDDVMFLFGMGNK